MKENSKSEKSLNGPKPLSLNLEIESKNVTSMAVPAMNVDIASLLEAARKSNKEEKLELEQQQVDTNEDRTLEQMIEEQAKEIEKKQAQAQKQEAQKQGKQLKISKAAKALNNLELGLDSNQQIENGNVQDIVPISTDQMYTNFGKTDEKTIQRIMHQDEAAAITMAKKAVSQYVNNHQKQTKFPEILVNATAIDKTNVELDLGQTADFRSQINDMSEEEGSAEPGYILSEEPVQGQSLAQSEAKETALPKWPMYNQPVQQFEEIKTELASVKDQQKNWQQLLKEAQDAEKSRSIGQSESQKKA